MGRRRKGDAVSGWICLDKPYDLTSTHAVSRVRRLFNAQKAGHAGTLDPLATGILPIALGEATKTVPFLMDADKAYRFTIAWGRTTATYDREGEIDWPSPTCARRVGRRSRPCCRASWARSARSRRPIRRSRWTASAPMTWPAPARPWSSTPRTVTIHSARVAEAPDADHVTLEIECGKGTYVRALARDLADALGACGHVSELRRTRVGGFTRRIRRDAGIA